MYWYCGELFLAPAFRRPTHFFRIIRQSTVSTDEKYYEHVRKEMLPFVPNQSQNILELGCAEGFFGAMLRTKHRAQVWGVEINPEAAAKATTRLDQVITGTVESALNSFADKSFDCIICNDILEHLIDPVSVLKSFHRLLSEDGVVVGSIPNVRYFPILEDLLIRGEWRYAESGVLDKTHMRFFTRNSLIRTLMECGYNIIRLEGINPTFSFKAKLASFMSFGKLEDCRYLQFAFVVRPGSNPSNLEYEGTDFKKI